MCNMAQKSIELNPSSDDCMIVDNTKKKFNLSTKMVWPLRRTFEVV